MGSAAVLASELMKLPFCLALIAKDAGGLRGLAAELREVRNFPLTAVFPRRVLGWINTDF